MTEIATRKSGFSLSEKHDVSFVPKRTSACMVGIAAAALLISGSFDAIIVKLMNKQNLPPCDGCNPKYFEAPFFQAWTMYIGAFYVDVWYAKRNNGERKLEMQCSSSSFNKPPCPRYLWAVPAFFDFVSTVMVNYAFVLSQASTVQLLRNFNIVVTALLSLVYIRVALRHHQILGVAVVTAGLVITGIYAMLNPDTNTNYKDGAWVGIVMALVGTLVSAFQFVFEESLFRKYYASPFEAVGMMGVFGIVFGGLGLIILQLLPFDWAEKTSETAYMMGHKSTEGTILVVSNICDVLAISIFNAAGLTITKFGSGLLRTIIVSARTVLVYLAELIIGWSVFAALNFCGLLVTVLGIIAYNYNYMFPRDWFCGDAALRHPVMCCALLVNPDTLESKATTPEPPPRSPDEHDSSPLPAQAVRKEQHDDDTQSIHTDRA